VDLPFAIVFSGGVEGISRGAWYFTPGLTATEDPSGSHAAADFGGGVDLRLSQFVSLRVDGRDYITPAGLGGAIGHTHPFVAGIAFHL
jgi:hypothetical protein